jgi:23S rRNA (adenine1618-N6)-methyltransferase
VLALNAALLKTLYGVSSWAIPAGYLCPPVPGRADYVHHVADLLSAAQGAPVRVLDVGVGANCIYPIIGRGEYGWSFVGSDVDPAALESAKRIVESNALLAGGVELRLQAALDKILSGLVRPGERFDAVMCNPPFHASRDEAEQASRRKWEKLGRRGGEARNFGGQAGELWFPGGEAAFARRMVEESASLRESARWFTVLLSKAESLPAVEHALKNAGATARRTIDMAQGQKKSRIVAWTFQ